MKVLIHCEAQKLPNGNVNPKNYPSDYWISLIEMFPKEWEIIQIGVEGEKQYVHDFKKNLSLKEIKKLIHECDFWIDVDSFLQHLAWLEGKFGYVIFSQSDSKIFGHKENRNFCNRSYLREHQFQTWEECEYNKKAFHSPEYIFSEIKKTYK